MVLEEIGRLSTKLNQLLQCSRRAVRGGSAIGSCDARVGVEEVTGVLSHEAGRRGVKMQIKVSGGSSMVAAGAGAGNDVVSDFVGDALGGAPRGGQVSVGRAFHDGACILAEEGA